MSWLRHVTAFRLSLLVIVGMLLLYAVFGHIGLPHHLETKTLDWRFRWRGVRSPGDQVVLVAIDDASITALGRWPWSRQRFATLVRRLHDAGARVIAFDLLFTEPEKNPVHDALQAVQTAYEALSFLTTDPRLESFHRLLMNRTRATDSDSAFATALDEAGTVVLAYAFRLTDDQHPNMTNQHPPLFLTRTAFRTLQNATPEATAMVPHGLAISLPIDTLGPLAQTLGHVNAGLDTDGSLRYDYPVVAYAQDYYPSLPIQVARLYLGLAPEEVKVQFGHGLQLGPRFIPTDQAMRLLVNYYGPQRTFPTYRASDVLAGRLPEALWHDKVVLVGSMATGLGDTYVTPFSPEFHSLEKHATVIANILQNTFLQRRSDTLWLDLLCLVLLGLLVGSVSPRLPLMVGWLYAMGLGGVYVVLNTLTFARLGWWVNLVFPLATVMVTQVAITIHRSLTEERQKHQIRRAFQYYLHPSVVEQVIQQPALLRLGGEVRELTVLFSDIRGFTRISEQLQPETLVQLLNEYLSAMTQLVLESDGLLDKYIGDALMAVYGAPVAMPDHAYRACHTALRMRDRLHSLQAHWHLQGLPEIDIGIGINTGSMVVGNMGSDLRFTYTVTGDAVNLGARLESANKLYGTHIIIGESTWLQVQDRLAIRELDAIRVQGKDTPVRIFEVLGLLPLSPQQKRLVRHFSQGLQAYRARRWDRAMDAFRQVLSDYGDDPPSTLYLQRCQTCKHTPPPPEWDGVTVMQSK